jgi:antitoxin component YwqK of YwqJK toxin-antitoxin module
MATDFMERLGLSLSKIACTVLLTLSYCHSPERLHPERLHPERLPYIEYPKVDADKAELNYRKGLAYLANVPFTGTLFRLYSGSTDTAELSGYHNGREQGIWRKFYKNGKPQSIREFDEGNKVGNYIAWWENGRKKLHYSFDKDEYSGLCQEWNSMGQLILEMHYRNGHEEGAQKMFYDNGKVRANYVVLNGRRYGLLGTKNCVNVSDSVFKN